MKKIVLSLGITTALMFGATGTELLQQKCASCHMLEKPEPEMIPTLKAPALDAVVFHIKLAIKNPEKQKAFIMNYVFNPDASKSVCESNKVAKFGVMPSQKGNVTKEELSAIADYMLKAYPHKAFVTMIKEIQRNDKMNALQNSPFLINKEGLPHLTGMLMKVWDKAGLGLTPEQKEKLLKIRKETVGGIKKLKPRINALENEVIEAMVEGEDPSKLDPQLEEIAKLKTEATRIHLKCIRDTLDTLNEEQIGYLLPFWDM